MTVTVVPILRVRRATLGWSYKVPASMQVQPGSLVIVPFRNHPTLGVVWDTDENAKATAQVTEVLTHTPLVRAPHRHLIEWLADQGICSLSTALYTWLPGALRALPLTKPVHEVLAGWDTHQVSATQLAQSKQHAVLVPNHRDEAAHSLGSKYGEAFANTFTDTTPAQEFQTWVKIAHGEVTVAIGREQALYAPWVNLRHVTVIEPEDISYHTGQTPYLNLVDAATYLATSSQAALTCRSNIPLEAARQVWSQATGIPSKPASVELTDLRHAKLVNPGLIQAIQRTLEAQKQVLVLYNAHDRWKRQEDGLQTVIPGIETLSKQLALALGSPTLPPQIHFGTRSILATLPHQVGLTVALSLDPLLAQVGFADILHGWGDIGRLGQAQAPLFIQTHHPEHPLVQAILNNRFEAYCLQEVEEAKKLGLPPFSEHIVCALPTGKEGSPTPAALASELQALTPTAWLVSHPRAAMRRGKPMTIITLQAPLHQRVPANLRKLLAALPRPWKVERGPWYAI